MAPVTLMSRAVAALAVAVLLLCLPSTSLAAGDSPEHDRSSAKLLSVGVGYGHDAGSQPVRELQSRLRTLGYEPGPIDGRFGPLTEAAVERFQRAQGLTIDGVAGPRTGAALRRGGPGDQAGLQPVRKLQRELRALGYEPGPIDGIYGPLTEAAVERFQGAQGLAVDGVAGPQTAARLEAKRAALVPEPADRAAGAPRADRASGPSSTERARDALGDARPQHARPEPSPLAEPSSFADSSSPLLRPGYAALLAALALVLLLTGVRAARRRERTPAPAPQRVATRRVDTKFNPGLACAALLGALVVGAAGGALFANRASPDDRAEATAKSLLSGGAELLRSSASRSERTKRDRVAGVRVPSARRAARTASAGLATVRPSASRSERTERDRVARARVPSARPAARTASASVAMVRPSASPSERTERDRVARVRVPSARPAARTASASLAMRTRPTSAATLQDEPVLGVGETAAAAPPRAAEQPQRPATEGVPLAAEIARTPSDARHKGEDELAAGNSAAGVGRRLR